MNMSIYNMFASTRNQKLASCADTSADLAYQVMLGLVQDLACMYTYMCVHVHQYAYKLLQPVATLQSNREEYI